MSTSDVVPVVPQPESLEEFLDRHASLLREQDRKLTRVRRLLQEQIKEEFGVSTDERSDLVGDH